jgi:hypothetical protein
MKTVRDACQLQPNALSIKLSDQIEQLDELISTEGDGMAFFEKTFITQGMQDLISEGIARLAGASTQAIFHLKQAMGGGKTGTNSGEFRGHRRIPYEFRTNSGYRIPGTSMISLFAQVEIGILSPE